MKWTIIIFIFDTLLGLFFLSHPEIPERITAFLIPPPPPPPQQNSENHNEHNQDLDVLRQGGIRGGKSQPQEVEQATDKLVGQTHSNKEPSLRGARDSAEQRAIETGLALEEVQGYIVVLQEDLEAGQETKTKLEAELANLERPLHNDDKKKMEDAEPGAALVKAVTEDIIADLKAKMKESVEQLELLKESEHNLKKQLLALEQDE